MNYRKVYKNIMVNAKQSNRNKGQGIYYEKHHIVPNFMFIDRRGRQGPKGTISGNPDDSDNLVLLTAREHFIAHLLLVKIYKGTRYENAARKSLVWFFTTIEQSGHGRQDLYKMTRAKKYELYKQLAMDGLRNSMIGTMLVKDPTTGEKVGRVRTSHPKVLAKEWVHWTTGRQHSEEEIQNQRIRSSGMTNNNARPDVTKDRLVDAAVQYIVEYNLMGLNLIKMELVKYLEETLSVSSAIINHRFPGRMTELVECINKQLTNNNMDNIKYDPYYRGESQRMNASSVNKQFKWTTDGEVSKRVSVSDLQGFLILNPSFRIGRTIHAKN